MGGEHLGTRTAIPKLTKLLYDSDNGVRASAAYAVSLLASAEEAPLLLSMLEHLDPHVRASGASGLGRLKVAEGIGPLSRLLADQDQRVQRAAIWALRNLPDQGRVMGELLAMIRSVEGRSAVSLMAGLVHLDDKALRECVQQRCIDLLGDYEDPRVRASACSVLHEMPDARAIEPCLKLLQDEDPRVRASACAVLHEMPDARAVEPCLKLLQDEDPRVRASACMVLREMPDARAIEPCLKLLQDEDPRVRASACSLMAIFRLRLTEPQRKTAQRLVGHLLSDPEDRVRRSSEFAARLLADP